jgi:hypothetical protein
LRFELEELQPKAVNHELIWGSIGLFVALLSRFFPFDRVPLPPCLFHKITGIPCPTCGFTRAFRLMARLRLSDGFLMNPLAALVFAFMVVFVVYAAVVLAFRTPRIRFHLNGRRELNIARVLVAVVVISNWAYIIAAGR